MTQTREDRIRAHFKALRRVHVGYRRREGVSSLLMTMAQHWKTPIRELREILDLKPRKAKGPHHEPCGHGGEDGLHLYDGACDCWDW